MSRAWAAIALILLLAPATAHATRSSLAQNVFRVDVDVAGPASTSSCQLMVLVDLVVGAFEDERAVAQTPADEPSGALFAPVVEGLNTTSRSTSSCEQPIGNVTLVSGAVAGWDEVGAPSGAAWGASAPSEVVSVLTNRVRIHLEGDGPSAVAGCQLLVAVDALVLSASIEEGGVTAAEPEVGVANEVQATEHASASCDQRMETLAIIIDG